MVVQNRRGVSAVIVAICLVMLIGLAALAIDVGYLYTTRNQLQNVADAGALAGAGYLGSVYAGLSYSEQQNLPDFDRQVVVDAVNEVAQKNKAAGASIIINDEDIKIGNWNGTEVEPTLTLPNAVRVIARREEGANNPITTIFAHIFGHDTATVNAVATAALTGPQTAEKGELKVPFGLSIAMFPNNCTDEVTFNPTNGSCAGWHNFLDSFQGHGTGIEDKLFGLIQGDASGCDTCGELNPGAQWLADNFDLQQTPTAMETPAIDLNGDGDEESVCFNFGGGDVASLFNGAALDPSTYDGNIADGYTESTANPKIPAPFIALFDYFRYRDNDGNNDWWTATVPVYEEDLEDQQDCDNPQGCIKILGFAEIVIKMPNPPPDKTISVHVDCNQSFIQGRGGGGIFGNLRGTIPNLVE